MVGALIICNNSKEGREGKALVGGGLGFPFNAGFLTFERSEKHGNKGLLHGGEIVVEGAHGGSNHKVVPCILCFCSGVGIEGLLDG